MLLIMEAKLLQSISRINWGSLEKEDISHKIEKLTFRQEAYKLNISISFKAAMQHSYLQQSFTVFERCLIFLYWKETSIIPIVAD